MKTLIVLLLIAIGVFVSGVETGQIVYARMGWSMMVIAIFYLIMLGQVEWRKMKKGPGEPEPQKRNVEPS